VNLDTPKATAVLVFGALAVLVALRKTFASVNVTIG